VNSHTFFLARAVSAAILALSSLIFAGCTPSNAVMPLRGEEPAALAISGQRQQWLERTGATRAFDALHEALAKGQVAVVWDYLGPNTRTIVQARAKDTGTSTIALLKDGDVPGLALPGIEKPLSWLRSSSTLTATEAGPLDPTRRKVHVRVQANAAEVIEFPAVFTDDGWCIELVGLMEGAAQ